MEGLRRDGDEVEWIGELRGGELWRGLCQQGAGGEPSSIRLGAYSSPA